MRAAKSTEKRQSLNREPYVENFGSDNVEFGTAIDNEIFLIPNDTNTNDLENDVDMDDVLRTLDDTQGVTFASDDDIDTEDVFKILEETQGLEEPFESEASVETEDDSDKMLNDILER
ncbi:hypothetical protein FDP41_003328 [Naegleria fowleri]|uniref:Uncharacterized protein n=1 Tax=Naegleria fowleri TaxID=5763 RepID=A0A6A5BQJ2_NAEFO|nr:uncharacterized protein FDP41_003328 [Naegleria fowleri]KAF0977336.1 hypothetical protein FDP41_003328 [Naegleria fowleri]